jgi:hypothetical protein
MQRSEHDIRRLKLNPRAYPLFGKIVTKGPVSQVSWPVKPVPGTRRTMPPAAPLIPLGQTILLLYSSKLRLNGASPAFVRNARDTKSLVSDKGCRIERDQHSVEGHKSHRD